MTESLDDLMTKSLKTHNRLLYLLVSAALAVVFAVALAVALDCNKEHKQESSSPDVTLELQDIRAELRSVNRNLEQLIDKAGAEAGSPR